MYWLGRGRALALLVVAALAGALVGVLLGLPDDGPSPAGRAPAPASAPARATATSAAFGDLRLALPEGWSRDRRPERVPGVDPERALALRSTKATAVLAQVPPGHSSLLPGPLVEALVKPPGEPATVRGGRMRARRYDNLAWRDAPRSADVYVAPTTGGTVTLVCRIDERYELVAEDIECEPLLRALRLVRGNWVVPTPDTAFVAGLRPALVELNRERTAGRARLAAAGGPDGRGEAAAAVARAYGAALRGLEPLSAGTDPADRTLGLLAILELDYRRLAGRSRRMDRTLYARSATAIVRRERALAAALRGWDAALPQ
jgi:hypothetical protein